MTLSKDLEFLLGAVAPEGVVIYRSSEVQICYVLVQDRRLNGKPFDVVGVGGSLSEAASRCVERWDRATPEEVWTESED